MGYSSWEPGSLFVIGRRQRVALRLKDFAVPLVRFNATTRVFTPVTTFRQMTDTSDPRILQIAAKITF